MAACRSTGTSLLIAARSRGARRAATRRAILEATVPRTYGLRRMDTVDITRANRDGEIFAVDRRKPLLDSLEGQGVCLPYGCRYGACISCAAKLLSGPVDQRTGVALNGRQLAHGYVLLCIARPKSDCTFDVGVESHDKLYRNPFQSPLRPDELKPDRPGSQDSWRIGYEP